MRRWDFGLTALLLYHPKLRKIPRNCLVTPKFPDCHLFVTFGRQFFPRIKEVHFNLQVFRKGNGANWNESKTTPKNLTTGVIE